MLTGNILTTDGWIYGTLEYENGRITALTGERADPSTNEAPYILPGFIDLHVHGGGGSDVMERATPSKPSRARMPASAPRVCWPPP